MQPKVFRKLIKPTGVFGRSGFTLVEVLVVLAILVILFGLLFAPMMAGMDMATTGRAQARLQDTVRLTAEQMRRELANAMYVYPPPSYASSSGQVTDYSQLVFVLPASDSSGNPLTPRQPRTQNGEFLVTRYYVQPPTVTASRAYDETNPFVLKRQEGLYRFNAALGRYEFGSLDPDNGNAFTVGRSMSENAITPKENYDIPASSTLCLDCQQLEIGYVAACPGCSGTNLLYLHDDVKFQPERIVGEALVPSENNTRYSARHGNWMGTPNNGTVALAAQALSDTAPELQPRIVAYRWESGGYRQIALDSFTASVRSSIALRWNTTNGQVQVGDWCTAKVHVDASTDPGTAYWPLTITVSGSSGSGDTYDSTGALTGTQTTPLVPIYPQVPGNWNEPRMPIAYRLDPGYADGTTSVAAKLVPGSTRVFVSAAPASGTGGNRGEFTRAELSQTDLAEGQYAERLGDDRTWGEVQFSRFTPPSPDRYAGMSLPLFDLYVSFYYRRNFDPTTNKDDVIYADYSTGEIINITLIPQRFTDLEPYRAGLPNLVLPPDLPLGGVPVHTKAVVANARY